LATVLYLSEEGMMSLADLMPVVQALPRADKLRLVQLLVTDIAREEGVVPLEMDRPYPVWTPFDTSEAASVLLRALQDEGAGS
jgi:hypothetical protein